MIMDEPLIDSVKQSVGGKTMADMSDSNPAVGGFKAGAVHCSVVLKTNHNPHAGDWLQPCMS